MVVTSGIVATTIFPPVVASADTIWPNELRNTDAGVKVFGPAPRPMDVFPITVEADKSLTVLTGRAYENSGNQHNPARTIPYEPGQKTPPKIT